MAARSNEVWNFSHTSFTNEIANYVFILENKVFRDRNEMWEWLSSILPTKHNFIYSGR